MSDDPVITPVYRYRAQTVRVIDGDTYEFDIDLGMHTHVHQRVRYFGYSARESNTAEGLMAKSAASEILFGKADILVETHKDEETFSRFLAVVYVGGKPLHELLPDHLTPGVHMGIRIE